MSEPSAPDKCHTFICYRQSDGLQVAEWLFQRLHGRTITLDRSGKTLELDVYFDQDAPAIDDWRQFRGRSWKSVAPSSWSARANRQPAATAKTGSTPSSTTGSKRNPRPRSS